MSAIASPVRNRFGTHFQICFCAFMLRDSLFLSRVSEETLPDYFTDEALQRIVRIVNGFYVAHNAAPSVLIYHELDQLKEQGMLSVEMHARLNIILEELFGIDLQNSDYLLEEFDKFIRHQKIESYLPRLVELHGAGKSDEVEAMVRKMFVPQRKNILELGGLLDSDPRDRIKRRQQEDSKRSWLLIPEIDRRVAGLNGGEIGILQSQKSSIGKTAALVLFTRQFMFQRNNVLFCSLEESKERLEDRFDQCCAGISQDFLDDAEIIERGVKRYTSRGGVWIAKFPDATTKISDLRHYAEELRSQYNFKPDIVVIDYLDRIAPETASLRGDLFASGDEVVSHWREWMGELGVPGWSATQSTRGAATDTIADQQHTGRSIAKVQAADVQISINRSKGDADAGQTVIYIVKNRNGPALDQFTIETDMSRQLFWKMVD